MGNHQCKPDSEHQAEGSKPVQSTPWDVSTSEQNLVPPRQTTFPSELPPRPPKASKFCLKKKSAADVRSRVIPLSQSSSIFSTLPPCDQNQSQNEQSIIPPLSAWGPHIGSGLPPSPFERPTRKPAGLASGLSASHQNRSPSLDQPVSQARPPLVRNERLFTGVTHPTHSASRRSDPLAERFSRLRQAHVGKSSEIRAVSPPDSIPLQKVNGLELESIGRDSTMGKSRPSRHAPSPEAFRPYSYGPGQSGKNPLLRKKVKPRSPRNYTDDITYPDLNDPLEQISRTRIETPEVDANLPNPRRREATPKESLDRELAFQLQEEEDQAYFHRLGPNGASISLDPEASTALKSIWIDEMHPNSWEDTYSTLSNRQLQNSGTRDNPIRLDDSDSDSDIHLVDTPIEEDDANWPPGYDQILQEDRDAQIARQLHEEEEERLRQERPVTTRECAVCGLAVLIQELPSLAGCEHEPSTCADCFSGWIASELENKLWNEIKCPGAGCRVILQHHEVKQYATEEVYEKFDHLSARSAISDVQNFRWCRAPGCQSGQIHESGEEGPIFRCVACGHRVCVIHEDTWHEGETCEEYDYRKSGKKERDQKIQEEASIKAIDKLTKKCPGGCGWPIQKNNGCDHMTCLKCRHEFCWVCLAPYAPIRNRGNSAHRKDCKYHSSQIRG